MACPLTVMDTVSLNGCTGENNSFTQPFSCWTFSAPNGLAVTNPCVPSTGYQYSCQVSVPYGAKLRCLKGVRLLFSLFWLNSRPDCSSTYWPSVSVNNFSQIMPCRDSPQIQIFLPALSSCAPQRTIPNSSLCQ